MGTSVLEARYFEEDVFDGSYMVGVGEHRIQFGGRDGDGFCYGHQSFDCVDNLTAEEREAINRV